MNNIDSSGKVAIVCAVFIGLLIAWSELRRDASDYDRKPAQVTNFVAVATGGQIAEAFDRGILLGAHAALELASKSTTNRLSIASVYERVKTNPITAGAWNFYHQ